jgi:hypothetical protein
MLVGRLADNSQQSENIVETGKLLYEPDRLLQWTARRAAY